MEHEALSKTTIVLSIAAAVLAALDAMGVGIWLSASSWLITSAVTGIWAIYFRPKK